MDRFCPICSSKLDTQHMIEFIDYYCNAHKNHHYSERLIGEQQVIVKLRVNPTHHRMYCKINYKDNYTEIWEGIDAANRLKIEHAINIDYCDVDALSTKLRTYVIFS